MAYNRYNFLLRVKEVNDIYFKYNAQGVTTEYIYETYIYPRFKISRATFFNYLNIPYYKELEREEKAKERREEIKASQQKLNF